MLISCDTRELLIQRGILGKTERNRPRSNKLQKAGQYGRGRGVELWKCTVQSRGEREMWSMVRRKICQVSAEVQSISIRMDGWRRVGCTCKKERGGGAKKGPIGQR